MEHCFSAAALSVSFWFASPKAVLNTDSDTVLLQGLRRFTSQIRREHGLIVSAVPDQRGGPRLKKAAYAVKPASAAGVDSGARTDEVEHVLDEMDVVDGDFEGKVDKASGTDKEEQEGEQEIIADSMVTDQHHERGHGDDRSDDNETNGYSERNSSGNLFKKTISSTTEGERVGEGGRAAVTLAGVDPVHLKSVRETLVAAAEAGGAAGLLGEYLRGSPQLSDLFALWDLDARKVSFLPEGESTARRGYAQLLASYEAISSGSILCGGGMRYTAAPHSSNAVPSDYSVAHRPTSSPPRACNLVIFPMTLPIFSLSFVGVFLTEPEHFSSKSYQSPKVNFLCAPPFVRRACDRCIPQQSSTLLAAAHTDSMAAVLECLAVFLKVLATTASAASEGAISAVQRGAAIEAIGLDFCK